MVAAIPFTQRINHVARDQTLDALQDLKEPTTRALTSKVGLGTLDEAKTITETVAHPRALTGLSQGSITGRAQDLIGIDGGRKNDGSTLGREARGRS